MKEFLSRRSVKFREIDVSRDQASAIEMVRMTGQNGVPVTRINGQWVIGFDPDRINQLLAQATRPRLGAAVADAAEMAAKGRCSVTSGAYIGRVAPDGMAAKAGLQPGDVIVGLANQRVESAVTLENLVARLRPNMAVPLAYVRGTEQRLTTLHT